MKFHGWTINNQTISIGRFPDRKKIAMYITEGNTSSVLAWFLNETQASMAMDMLDKLAQAKYEAPKLIIKGDWWMGSPSRVQ